MQRVCFILRIKKDRLEEYKQQHRKVWPDMLDALRETGWRNYSLFLREDGLLVGYLETDDLRQSLRGMASKEINARWQREMAPFLTGRDGRPPDEGFLLLEEIFHLD